MYKNTEKIDTTQLEKDYEYLCSNAETGFNLHKTKEYVSKRLAEMGITINECGKCGLTALLGSPSAQRTLLLRADMDAINIEGKGPIHACGHAMHTAILLGAARVLKQADFLCDTAVKLMFQPAEETLLGCKDMIESGVLDNVDAAFMIHVTSGTDFPTGTFIFANAGEIAPSADFFDIEIEGIGSHGAEPHLGRSPITAAANIVTVLQNISSHELPIADTAVVTIGKINSGDAANAIPSKLLMSGTARAYSSEIQEYVKARIETIVKGVCETLRVTGKVNFLSGCPPFKNDEKMLKTALTSARKTVGEEKVILLPEGTRGGGSEDFAYISREVPTAMALLSAGEKKEGYKYPLHNPNVTFDKSALAYGVALMINIVREFGKE